MKLEKPKTKEQARDQAIQIDKEISEKQNISYCEIITISEHFEKVGKKFGLLDEFRENGII